MTYWYAAARSSTAPVRRLESADVRVRDGLIVEVAPGLRPDGEPTIDATGAFVIPGIIETHTHLDGAMWWNPDLDPLPAYGNTTAVFGYCGNSIAPLAGAQRDEVVDLLCFLEDLPVEAFRREIPWTWERWPDYMTAIAGQPTTLNLARLLRSRRVAHLCHGRRRVGAGGDRPTKCRDVRAARRGAAARRDRVCRSTTSTKTAVASGARATSPTTPSTPRCSTSSPAIPAARCR